MDAIVRCVVDYVRVGVTTIKLRNRGADAFRPDEYGSSITVERRLTSDGSSGYKLMNERGMIPCICRDCQRLDRLLLILCAYCVMILPILRG